jgi:hypothetical protein
MNFLALITKPFKQEAPKVSASLVAYTAYDEPKECLQRPLQVARMNDNTHVRHNTPAERAKAWNEPKRIQRLRALAELSSYGNSQIDGVKVNGLFAELAMKMYDSMNEQGQHNFARVPMAKLVECVTLAHEQDIV